MKKIVFVLMACFLLLVPGVIITQERYIEQRRQDFENFRREREQSFSDFVEQRERELQEMKQAYQDYYNGLHGLRDYYIERNETENATIVEELIEFEDQISQVTGRNIEVTEVVIVEEEEDATGKETGRPSPVYHDTLSPDEVKAYDEADPVDIVSPAVRPPGRPEETTFVPLPEEGSDVPVLTPLQQSLANITSPFGVRRHPILNRRRMHNGVDFGSGMNALVYAAADGTVKLAQYSNSFGNWIIIEHKNDYSSVYAHLNSFNVRKGDRVSKGDIIGRTGNTGRSTAPHLHYEVRLKGNPINPEGYLVEYME